MLRENDEKNHIFDVRYEVLICNNRSQSLAFESELKIIVRFLTKRAAIHGDSRALLVSLIRVNCQVVQCVFNST